MERRRGFENGGNYCRIQSVSQRTRIPHSADAQAGSHAYRGSDERKCCTARGNRRDGQAPARTACGGTWRGFGAGTALSVCLCLGGKICAGRGYIAQRAGQGRGGNAIVRGGIRRYCHAGKCRAGFHGAGQQRSGEKFDGGGEYLSGGFGEGGGNGIQRKAGGCVSFAQQHAGGGIHQGTGSDGFLHGAVCGGTARRSA